MKICPASGGTPSSGAHTRLFCSFRRTSGILAVSDRFLRYPRCPAPVRQILPVETFWSLRTICAGHSRLIWFIFGPIFRPIIRPASSRARARLRRPATRRRPPPIRIQTHPDFFTVRLLND